MPLCILENLQYIQICMQMRDLLINNSDSYMMLILHVVTTQSVTD